MAHELKELAPPGRPLEYTQAIGNKIFFLIASGKSVRAVCRMSGMPAQNTFYHWLQVVEGFQEQYARATELRADARFELISEIVNDVLNGLIDPQAGNVAINALRWQAGKEKPKKYGERSTVDVLNSDGSLKGNLNMRLQMFITKIEKALEQEKKLQGPLIEGTAQKVEYDGSDLA